MNAYFMSYLQALPPRHRSVASEAVETYLKGEGVGTEKLTSAWAIYEKVRYLAARAEEYSVVLLMNHSYGLIKTLEIGRGGLTETMFDIRVIFREALLANATIIAIAHNHPSGKLSPSRQDDTVTENVKKAAELLHIKLCDHIIVGDGSYYSYMEEGRL